MSAIQIAVEVAIPVLLLAALAVSTGTLGYMLAKEKYLGIERGEIAVLRSDLAAKDAEINFLKGDLRVQDLRYARLRAERVQDTPLTAATASATM